MNFDPVEAVANAVLYEGYILYPYRASAIKNRQRWNFGTLYPRAFAAAQHPAEPCSFHTDTLIEASAATTIHLRLRFLQLVPPRIDSSATWEQGFARAHTLSFHLTDLLRGADHALDLTHPDAEELGKVPADFTPVPIVVRLAARLTSLSEGLYRLSVDVSNETPLLAPYRSAAHPSALTSAHLLLEAEAGAFVSLLEPDPRFEAAAAACRNAGVFPVLAGTAPSRSHMLCSPIIFYDYPHTAPESPGDFFDSTEMDEMLALRVLTLTDAEKAELRSGDERARALLDRTETLPGDHLLKLHGAIRGMRPAFDPQALSIQTPSDTFDGHIPRPPVESVCVFGVDLHRGDRVRLWPQRKADIFDIAVEGKIAVIEAIEQDFEDNIHFAVVLEDDPGRDLGMLRQPGHRFFYTPEEVEPLSLESS